jgi:hypothetical protein
MKPITATSLLKPYPSVVDFEVTEHVIVAASRNHGRDNPLALALTDRLETRYLVCENASGGLSAQPWDDPDPDLAAGENAPWYELDEEAVQFLDAFNSGGDLLPWYDHWFLAKRIDD